MAARTLWQLGDRSGRILLIQLLADSDLGHRRFAVESIGSFGDTADVWVLSTCLDDRDSEVRVMACRGLRRITAANGVTPASLASSEKDVALWKDWYQKYRDGLPNVKQLTPKSPVPKPAGAKESDTVPEKLKASWTDLASMESPKGYRAMWALLAAPQQLKTLLRDNLHPVPSLSLQNITDLIARLDHEQFDARDRAAKELEHQGELAEPALRKALESQPSAQARQQIKLLLGKLENRVSGPEILRPLRALTLLEEIGTDDARDVLGRLAKGAPGAWLTQEAVASLERLAKRKTEGP